MHKDETDVRLLLKTHGDAIYRSAYLLLGNPHDVQDILQEVLLRFLEKAPSDRKSTRLNSSHQQ